MANTKPSNDLSKALFDLYGEQGYRTDEFFRWMVNDVLHGFGVQPPELPPEAVHKTLFKLGGLYADMVFKHEPFFDVLGTVYMDIVSRWGQKHLGQYFTPWPLASMMAKINLGDHSITKHRLTRLCDPAVGSGVMMLSACAEIIKIDPEMLKWLSLTGIDLDPTCARLFPAQVFGNLLVHQFELGELVAYHGNALGDPVQLKVVVHSTRRDLEPELLIPADPVVRKPMLEQVTQELQASGDQMGFSFEEVN